jgi:hypothetical protein
MTFSVSFESMGLILFKLILTQNPSDVALGYFLETINVGAFQGESVGQNVGLEGLTGAFDMEEMPAVIKTLKGAVIEAAIANLAHYLLFLFFWIFVVHLLLQFASVLHILLLDDLAFLIDHLLQFQLLSMRGVLQLKSAINLCSVYCHLIIIARFLEAFYLS